MNPMLTQRSSSAAECAGFAPGDCGNWHTPMKFFGNSETTRAIRSLQICDHSRLTLSSPM